MRPSSPQPAAGATLAAGRSAGQPDAEEDPAVWLSVARDVFGPRVNSVTVQTLKHTAGATTVYRLGLSGVDTAAGPLRLIAKRTAGGRADDDGPMREALFLSHLLGQVAIPQPRVYFAGPVDGGRWLTLVEDVTAAYRFAAADHPWKLSELRPILTSYAALHAQGGAALSGLGGREWLFPPYQERVAGLAGELPAMAEALAAAAIWQPIPGLGRLVERTVRALATTGWTPTLVHNDVTPANAGLPRDGDGPALLVDWEMVGSGPAELDLAYMFMQPFDNTRAVDRQAALAWYWQQRRLAPGGGPPGEIPRPAERARAQHLADAVLALWLIPVAHQRLLTPFPPGSAPRRYWDAMSRVLERRLRELCAP